MLYCAFKQYGLGLETCPHGYPHLPITRYAYPQRSHYNEPGQTPYAGTVSRAEWGVGTGLQQTPTYAHRWARFNKSSPIEPGRRASAVSRGPVK